MDEKHPKGFACGIRKKTPLKMTDYFLGGHIEQKFLQEKLWEVFLCKKSENSMQIPLWN